MSRHCNCTCSALSVGSFGCLSFLTVQTRNPCGYYVARPPSSPRPEVHVGITSPRPPLPARASTWYLCLGPQCLDAVGGSPGMPPPLAILGSASVPCLGDVTCRMPRVCLWQDGCLGDVPRVCLGCAVVPLVCFWIFGQHGYGWCRSATRNLNALLSGRQRPTLIVRAFRFPENFNFRLWFSRVSSVSDCPLIVSDCRLLI